MYDIPTSLLLVDEAATTEFASALASNLKPGDTILLEGPVGAGKTHFARGLIQSVLHRPEDVPSPTFTLVQTYDTQMGEIWHADLYRVSSTDELEELGLWDAFDQAICLIEWPDRLGHDAPAHALTITFASSETDSRRVELQWTDPKWHTRLDKVLARA